jgi:uncharacterized protein (TIGR04255 family)
MSKKLRNAPLFFTIIQVRFNTILTLDTYVPQIQDRLRKAGFPDMNKALVATIPLMQSVFATAEGQIQIARNPRYTFGNIDRTSNFVLDPNAISFQTTQYDRFAGMLADFMKGLEAVHECVPLDFTDRLGTRFLNAVVPKSGLAVKDYLTGSILGLREKVGDVVHSFSETLTKQGDINVRARVIIQKGPLAFPPDLANVEMKLLDRFTGVDTHHALLDTDGWSESREAFNYDTIKKQFIAIHDKIEELFEASVTAKAMKEWE